MAIATAVLPDGSTTALMGLHCYCVTRAHHVPAHGGLDGAVVRAIGHQGIAMLVSEHATRPDASIAAVRQHNDVVVAAMDIGTPVPLRFGQWIADPGSVVAALITSHEKWAVLLDRFEGAVEMGLRVFEPGREAAAANDEPARTGTAYMAALAQRIGPPDAARREVVAALETALKGIVLDERVEPLKTEHGVASVAHLLHRANVEAYREAMAAVRAGLPRLRLLSTGPWPPYSFVE